VYEHCRYQNARYNDKNYIKCLKIQWKLYVKYITEFVLDGDKLISQGITFVFWFIVPWFKFILILILLTWIIWWAPNNFTRWHMGFNSAFKGLKHAFNSRQFPRKNQKYFSKIDPKMKALCIRCPTVSHNDWRNSK